MSDTVSRNGITLVDGGIFGPSIQTVDSTSKAQAHLYVLRNMAEVVPYVDEHMKILRVKAHATRKGIQWIQNEHNRSFASWFAKKVSEDVDDQLEMGVLVVMILLMISNCLLLENKQVYKRIHFSSEKEKWAQMFLERIVPMYVARR
ncbi:hypothetical protein ACFE04_012454 [Oxalis oulophora]